MKKSILSPRAGQRATAMRLAFVKALAATPEHTRITGKVFSSLCTAAGLVRI